MAEGPNVPQSMTLQVDPKLLLESEKYMSQLRDAAKEAADQFEAIDDSAQKINKTTFDVILQELEKTKDAGTAVKNMLAAAGDIVEKRFPRAFAIGKNMVAGLAQGFRNLSAVMRTVASTSMSVISGIVRVSASIAAIPLRILQYFIKTANDGMGGSNELMQAIENLRKEFGYLTGPSPQAIMKMSVSLNGFADTGLNAFRIFGNLAKRLEDFLKLAQEMGPAFQFFVKEFSNNGGALLAYQKGLGLSGELMKNVAGIAASQGETFASQLKEITKYSLDMGKSFGIDAKLISRDMGKALGDVKHFAGATVKGISEASVYARKLGVELDKITGVLDQFETFDSAAESTAKLSQAFGVQVDAFEMMESQNPADSIDKLRKAMSVAGVDASTFNRQQLALLKSTTGLDEATTRQVFSQKNAGMSLDEIKKKSGETEKKTLTQAQAMGKLADAIERLVLSGGGQGAASFFDRFIHGFIGGIQSSQEFWHIMQNIRLSLISTEMAGVRLGRAFVQIFPGVKQFLEGIGDLFRPAKFQKLTGDVVTVFIDWFKKLSTGKWSFDDLMKQLRQKFFDFFDTQSSAGRKTIDSFKKIFKTIVQIIAEGIKWAAEQMKGFLTWLVDVIKNPSEMLSKAKGAGGAGGMLTEIFTPLYEAFIEAGNKLLPKLTELFRVLVKKIIDVLLGVWREHSMQISASLGAIILGPMIGKAVLSTIVTAGVKKVGGLLNDAVGKYAQAKSRIPQTLPGGGGPPPLPSGKDLDVLNNVQNRGSGIRWGDIAKFLVGFAGVIVIGVLALVGAIVLLKGIGASTGDIVNGLIAIGGILLAAGVAAFSMELINKIGAISWEKIGKFMIGFAIMTLTGIAAIVGATALMSYVSANKEKIELALLAVGGISVVAVTMAPLLYALSKIPLTPQDLGRITLGLTVIGLSSIVIVGTAALLSGLIGKSQTTEKGLELAAKTLWSFTGLFMLVGLSLIEMMGIGALLLSTSGFAAGFMLVGFAAIEAGVIAMTGSAVAVAKIIDKMGMGGSQMESKTKVFVDIMHVLLEFVHAYVSLSSTLQSDYNNADQTFTAKTDAFGKLLDKVVGGEGSGLIGIMNSVKKIVESFASNDKIAAGAKVFSDVMGAVSSLLQVMQPNKDLFADNNTSLASLIVGGETFKQKSEASVAYLDKVMGAFGDVSAKMSEFITKTQTAFVDMSPEKATTISTVVSALANVLKAAVPTPELVAAFKDTSSSMSYTGFDQSTSSSTTNVRGLIDFFNIIFKSVGEIVPNIIDPIMKQMAGLTVSPEKAKLVESIMTGITEVMSVTGKIIEIIKDNKVTTTGNPAADMAAASAAAQRQISASVEFEKLFTALETHIPSLVKSITGALTIGIDPATLASKIDTVVKLIAAVKSIADIGVEIAGLGKNAGGAGVNKSAADMLSESLDAVATLLLPPAGKENMFVKFMSAVKGLPLTDQDANVIVSKANVLTKVSTATKTMLDAVHDMKSIADAGAVVPPGAAVLPPSPTSGLVLQSSPLDSTIAAVSSIAAAAPRLMSKLADLQSTNLGTTLSSFVKEFSAVKIASEALTPAVEAVTAMVAATQALDTALAGTNAIDIRQKIAAFATKAGIGGTGVYTVQSKDITLTVNLTVVMETGTLEETIITNQKSVIRDRLNFLGDDLGYKTKEPLFDMKLGASPALVHHHELT